MSPKNKFEKNALHALHHQSHDVSVCVCGQTARIPKTIEGAQKRPPAHRLPLTNCPSQSLPPHTATRPWHPAHSLPSLTHSPLPISCHPRPPAHSLLLKLSVKCYHAGHEHAPLTLGCASSCPSRTLPAAAAGSAWPAARPAVATPSAAAAQDPPCWHRRAEEEARRWQI